MKSLRDHFLRIDARSLGLFRVTFGMVLIADLFARWRWLRDFYSNEGVLPNHNHLFNLREKQEVFSVFHAFSTVGEAHFAFALTLVAYVFFLIGYRTRIFHVLSVVLLVSLTARNVLLENTGNYAAIAILAFTAFLPCGSRLSLDSLRASMALTDEKRAAELNDGTPPSPAAIAAGRLPGWSPVSLAALAVLLQIATIYLCSALQKHGGAWRDGTALHYALHVDRWVSEVGGRLRDALPAGTLRALTFGVRGAELAIPALLFVPALFRWTRGLAAALMVLHGLLIGLLFDVGLFGWALAASAPLVIPGETWDAIDRSSGSTPLASGRVSAPSASTPRLRHARTIVYDADCGVCLWLARVLKRLDLRGRLTFQGNDDLGELLVRGDGGALVRVPMPAEVNAELVERTVLAIDARGRVFTRGRAVAEALRALPFGWLALPLRLPGASHALDALYDAIAPRRHRLSVLMGEQACGIDLPEDGAGDGAAPGLPERAPAAIRTARTVVGSLREAAVLIVLAAMLAQTAKENPLTGGLRVPQGPFLAGVAAWPRMLAKWDLFAPEPPRVNAMLVIDGQTRTQDAMDPLTGEEPQLNLSMRGPVGMGQLWSDYVDRIRQKEWSEFQRSFRDYITRGGPLVIANAFIVGFDAYWVSQAIPVPGEPAPEGAEKEKIFTHSRGGTGKFNSQRLPLINPGLLKNTPR